MEEDLITLTTKEKWQSLFIGLAFLAILCALVSPIMFFGEERGWIIYWGRVAFFIVAAYMMLVLATEKEIRLDKRQGTIEFVETKPFSMPTSKKYRVSELRLVKYYGRRPMRMTWGSTSQFRSTAIDFFFKDGAKASGFVRRDYVPKQKEFPGVKIEYIY